MKLSIFLQVVALLAVQSGAGAAENAAAGLDDPLWMQVQGVFAQAEELTAQTEQRSREYLLTAPDDEFAKVYARATAPQAQARVTSEHAQYEYLLETTAKDRQELVEALLDLGARPLDEQGRTDYRIRHAGLVERLAALGSGAVPAIASRMSDAYRSTSDAALARESLRKMGPGAIEPPVPLLDSDDEWLRRNVVGVLSEVADGRAKDALLRALDDESGTVRRYALQGLTRLGPDVVGAEELVVILIRHLEDASCLDDAIRGLGRYGDETALEPLLVIERFGVGRDKFEVRHSAARAVNAILNRAGVQTEETRWEDYDRAPGSCEELAAAACCPNAALRSDAIARLKRLAALGDSEVVPSLRARQQDSDPTIQAFAAFALTEIASSEVN
ncbi:MAG: HEAT repeat domain-containing protein [Sedimentisphaerales bacterium]|nr:HEAT repeat domain-containing protein [Sedimentisphaerales bacterium]